MSEHADLTVVVTIPHEEVTRLVREQIDAAVKNRYSSSNDDALLSRVIYKQTSAACEGLDFTAQIRSAIDEVSAELIRGTVKRALEGRIKAAVKEQVEVMEREEVLFKRR